MVMEAIMPAFNRFCGLSIRTSTEYTRLLGSAAAEMAVTCPEKPLGNASAWLDASDRGVGNAEHRLHRASIGERKAVGSRTDQSPNIHIPLEHPGVERRSQLAVVERQFGFGDRGVRTVNSGLCALVLRAGIVVVRLSSGTGFVERRYSAEGQRRAFVLSLGASQLRIGLVQLLLVIILLDRSQDSSLPYIVALVDIANVSIVVAHLANTDQVTIRLEREIYLLIRLDVGGVRVGRAGIDVAHLGGAHRHGRCLLGRLVATADLQHRYSYSRQGKSGDELPASFVVCLRPHR
jgi:hypothetical protein